MNDKKLCRDCKYHQFPGECWRVAQNSIHLVSGQTYTVNIKLAFNERYENETSCGLSGKYFEPKESMFTKFINLFKKS